MGLDDLLSHPKIWKGTGDGFKPEVIPTGFAALDRYLPGGGWPQKAITEIFVDRYGIGELSLLMPACVTQQSVIWIAPPYIPYAPALLRYGLRLERSLLVKCSDHPQDVLWAIEQVLIANFEAAVFAWIKTVSHTALRRLQLDVEEQNSWTVFFRPMSALRQRSPAALQLRLSGEGSRTSNGVRIEILKCRGGKPGVVDIDASEFPKLEKNLLLERAGDD
jgi:hypothetical protein